MSDQEQDTGLNRNILDKYYTRKHIAHLCKTTICNHVDIDFDDDIIIEPSAGNGIFLDVLSDVCSNIQGYDIAPENTSNKKIIKQDFFTLDGYLFQFAFKKIHVIGNPPFGRQSSLAFQFINHAASFCDTISFILPKSFRKDSMIAKMPPYFHLLKELELQDDSFEVNQIIHSVPCVFQIWEKRPYMRFVLEKVKPIGYHFVKKTEQHDISFRRVGAKAGTIALFNESSFKSAQSHYFIRFMVSDKEKSEIIRKIYTMEFEHNNTVGPKSISKQELIRKINEFM